MVCHLCQAANAKKSGRDRSGNQRFKCRSCRRTFSERPARLLPAAMRISPEKAELILTLLCEGSGIRSIGRTTGAHQVTILKLLAEVGAGCERMLSELVKGVPVRDVEADEVWGYVHCKEGTKTRKNIQDPEAGDAYCFIGLERHSKLVLAWHLGRRNSWDTHDFIEKLSAATTGLFHLSRYILNTYPDAVEYNFGARVDYAQLVKEFGQEGEKSSGGTLLPGL
jgi:transposase-like protein